MYCRSWLMMLVLLVTPSTGFFPGMWTPPKRVSSNGGFSILAPPSLSSNVVKQDDKSLILEPSPQHSSLPPEKHVAIILVPGCFLKPHQYESVARAIQQAQQQQYAVWIHVPKQLSDFATAYTVGSSVQQALKELQQRGYPNDKAFVGGHSLGGAFLPSLFEIMRVNQVEGLLHVGCILSRDSSNDDAVEAIPHLTVCGDLDGLVRTSRIAEDYYRHVESVGNSTTDKMNHAVVLVQGMNHFGIVQGNVVIMDDLRDLKAEISHQESVTHVASAIAQFVAYHRSGNETERAKLLLKTEHTYNYIQPIIEAMHLEGSYHMDTPCHLLDGDKNDSSSSCVKGSPWAALVQRDLSPDGVEYGEIRDEFHQSWWINPLADPPFYHPSVTMTNNNTVAMETVSEPVYEKSDYYLFDAGFFSNAAIEIRSKMNSPQSILKARGIVDAKFDINTGVCSQMNERTIQWALARAPAVVRKRYQKRGVKLAAGKDIPHSLGPSWIWSYLEFQRVDDQTVLVDSHTMSTPLNHPVPFAGGKLYCKLLSPAKALDWMYTDSLRPPKKYTRVINEGLFSPTKFLRGPRRRYMNSLQRGWNPFDR